MSDDRLLELYGEAVELDEPGRRAMIDRLRTTAPALAGELAELLEAPETAPSPIDGSPLAAAGIEPGDETAPRRVGPYRIVRELGRGGMGRVFLAEQVTPDFRRTVALKLIDRPGPDDEAVRRFRDEVRILAALDHPGIVRFLDGGRSPERTWFIALEYVEGDDLLTHARGAALDVPDRVRLFLGVVEAVAFAHARGVVHRDLKPANVLVDRDGRPRLLDFGISKLFGAPGNPDPTLTRADRRPLTPAYASPEQLAGEKATTVSDVYSLGVVLYELLAGRRPAGGGSSVPELERDAASAGPEAPSSARRRGSTSTGWRGWTTGRAGRGRRSRIDRNLDAICLQALQPDPARRYPSAGALAADLRRHLEGRRAGARRSGPLRRSAPFAALAALIVLGSVVWLARPRPEVPAAEPETPARAAGFPFDPINPPPVEEMERRFAAAPDDVVAGGALALGLDKAGRASEALIVIGRLRQIPGQESDPLLDFIEGRVANNAGEHQRALVFYTRARDGALAEERHDLLGTIRSMRGRVLAQLGQREAAVEELELARADNRRAGDDVTLYRTLNDLAIEYIQRGAMEQGEESLEEAVAAGRRGGLEPLVALRNLAEVKYLRGRPDAAEVLAREVIELRRQRSPDRRLTGGLSGSALALLAAILHDLGRPDEAEPLLEQGISLLRAAKSETVADVLHARAVADLEAAHFDRIDSLIAELEAAAREGLRRRPLGYADSVRARAAAVRGDLDGARSAFGEAHRLLLSEGDRDLAAIAGLAWAKAEAAAGAPDAARRVLDEALASLDHAAATEAGWFAEVLRARLDAAAGRPDAARERLARLGDGAARSPSVRRRLAYLRARADLAAAEGRPGDARADLEEAIAVARTARRKLQELELRLDLAAVAGDPATAARITSEVESEASRLGLVQIATRARAAGVPAPEASAA